MERAKKSPLFAKAEGSKAGFLPSIWLHTADGRRTFYEAMCRKAQTNKTGKP